MIWVIIGCLLGIGSSAVLKKPSPEKYSWSGCGNLGKCQLDGYSHPPLLILSFDGFSREYLNRKIVKSLDLIAECGVKADRVIPSFPSKTFPNHYTMVTGLYPESHGITDNSVFDSSLYPELLAMRKPEAGKFYGGEPIWSAYKRLSGRPAHCLFWPGCYFNNTGFMPDIAPEYNETLPLNERIETIVSWLKLPSETRPGLITAYLHQPDAAGHKQKDIDQSLEDVDTYIDSLLTTLNSEGILECINLVIISDHGMQPLNHSVNISNYVNLDGLVLSKGVVARIHLDKTARSIEQVAEEIRCKIDGIKVNRIEDLPVRKHYAKSKRVGDIIIEGQPGSTFYEGVSSGGDHGYDYYQPSMHTVMFTRGPFFRPKSIVPSFQNVQYMNLWLSLLGIEGAVENNGTIGFFDEILKNPPIRENSWDTLDECPSFGSPDVLQCQKMPNDVWKTVSQKIENCGSTKNLPIYSDNLCFQHYCENSIIVGKFGNDSRRAVIEVVTSSENSKSGNFSFINTKYSDECPENLENAQFFSVGENAMSKMAMAKYKFPEIFVKKVLDPLQELTTNYKHRFGKLFVISGISTKDEEKSRKSTYFYRILITCSGNWLSTSPPLCRKFEEMKALSFIFPVLDKKSAIDCMSPESILLDYTSTIEDVEKIGGFKFQLGAISHQQNVYLRRNITTELW